MVNVFMTDLLVWDSVWAQ